ncbi:hypothetical protein B0G80_6846 [Paraburkholderia sp. BL6669N2]|uniref:hypothetical protein n=1 Tax=Paraburkholderia sp. BL6669N2 TaxID=1938807 RepID=UPI000E2628E5|nr:hypothetical protein [Paraburkholderia sp. BL6669N2]REG50417.1 hypothetical protein B0G80_6846 [Paraburkholderia sp. BL6669N2]
MKEIWVGILIACALLMQASAQNIQGSSTTVVLENTKVVFSCSGSSGTQVITASVSDEHLGDRPLVGPQRVDEAEDCAQVTWTVQPGAETGVQLVMANPGRLGLDAQMLVFYADKNGVDFAGYLPVAADSTSPGRFRVVGNDAYGKWERIYAFKDRKLSIAQELILMQSGSVCLERSGIAKMNLPCVGSTTKASRKKPVCVIQRDGRAKLGALRACASLTVQR